LICRNIFRDLSGTPLKDIGPDPVCMPDPDNDPDAGMSCAKFLANICCFCKHKCAIIFLPADYNEVKYNVVANPRLVFSMNSFHKFNLSFLEFPGAK
jgi:hypothetical protein